MTHLEHLEKIVGSLKNKKLLDIGSGKGNFLIECMDKGYSVVGVEINIKKVEKAFKKAESLNLKLKIIHGAIEKSEFPNDSFDFINVAEVIEHVKEPEKVLNKMNNVLKKGGIAYISVQNRFCLYDTHFHVYFLNWMPRFLCNFYLSLLRKHKDYEKSVDYQNIKDMHYYTFNKFQRIATNFGFRVKDIRELRIKKEYSGITQKIYFSIYRLLRPFYFSTFHFLLVKE